MKQSRADILRDRYAKIQKSVQNNHTETLYIFENHKNLDFSLPRKSVCGKKMIGPRGRFTGDDYFLNFVKTGDLRMIEILPPKTESVTEQINESSEVSMEKLILDQPEKFTTQGKTEHVVTNPPHQQKLSEIAGEGAKLQPTNDVLLNEHPMDGIDIVNG
jgi:hypothetical protein